MGEPKRWMPLIVNGRFKEMVDDSTGQWYWHEDWDTLAERLAVVEPLLKNSELEYGVLEKRLVVVEAQLQLRLSEPKLASDLLSQENRRLAERLAKLQKVVGFGESVECGCEVCATSGLMCTATRSSYLEHIYHQDEQLAKYDEIYGTGDFIHRYDDMKSKLAKAERESKTVAFDNARLYREHQSLTNRVEKAEAVCRMINSRVVEWPTIEKALAAWRETP